MSLLSKAKKEKRDEISAQEMEENRKQQAQRRKLAEERDFRHQWYLHIKGLVEERNIRLEEIEKGWPFARLVKGKEVIGYFHNYEASGSEYVSDYGCDVPWHTHEIAFSPREHYSRDDRDTFFSATVKDDDKETLQQIERYMINFYKQKGWV